MQYFITFLEGIISFISPCMLPMLPVYFSYLAGGNMNGKNTIIKACAFVVGFTAVFVCLGVFAGTVGRLLSEYHRVVNVVCGIMMIVFALGFVDIIKLPFFKGMSSSVRISGTLSAFLFGMVFSVSLTPCVGAFLGSALMMASTSEGAYEGALLLLSYSGGIGVPFVMSAFLLDRLSGLFVIIKKNYRVINIVCAIFLICVGIAMMTGLLTKFLRIFS